MITAGFFSFAEHVSVSALGNRSVLGSNITAFSEKLVDCYMVINLQFFKIVLFHLLKKLYPLTCP